MMKKMYAELTKELEKVEEINVTVSIDCDSIYLKNTHDMTIYSIEETENAYEFDTHTLTFSVGKDCVSSDYNEFENEYTFVYENGIEITITVL